MRKIPNLSIGIDVGGSHIEVGVVDSATRKILDSIRRDIDPELHWNEHLAITEELIGELLRRNNLQDFDELKMGIALPGTVSPKMDICYKCPNLPSWRNVEVRAELQERLKRRGINAQVFAVNDVNAATLGEYLYLSTYENLSSDITLLHLAIGTGVGGGLLLNGRLITGSRGLAGEIGHITVDPSPDAPLCGCGNRGCLEAHSSGKAIRRKAKERLGLDREVKELAELAPKIPELKAIFEEAGRYLALAIIAVLYTVDLDMVILSGGVAKAHNLILPALKDELRNRVRMTELDLDKFILLARSEKPHLIGAAMISESLILT